jgi:hypothetical protein
MLRNGTVVLAVLLVLGSSGSAVARDGSYNGRSAGDGFRDDHFGGGLAGSWNISGNDSRRHANRVSGSGGGFRGDGGSDVWGHWGAYYGPMVSTI